MHWEAIAINADFWSQVLQGISLKPLDFALGAVMAVRRQALEEIGGFAALVDCLADDYQLGHRIAQRGHQLSICPVVVECWSEPMGWLGVWKHQLRWARTIRVCQPLPYFCSILGNATLWPLLWLATSPSWVALAVTIGFLCFRISSALDLYGRLLALPYGRGSVQSSASADPSNHESANPPIHHPSSIIPSPPSGSSYPVAPNLVKGGSPVLFAWLVPLKDLLQALLWILAFLGNRIEWRGQKFRMKRDGTLIRMQ
jgi:ceramide glucosyltransferase